VGRDTLPDATAFFPAVAVFYLGHDTATIKTKIW